MVNAHYFRGIVTQPTRNEEVPFLSAYLGSRVTVKL